MFRFVLTFTEELPSEKSTSDILGELISLFWGGGGGGGESYLSFDNELAESLVICNITSLPSPTYSRWKASDSSALPQRYEGM